MTVQFGLKDKVIVVTGSGRPKGLGQGILQRFADEGAKCVVSDLGAPREHMGKEHIGSSSDMEEVTDELKSRGAEAISIPCDVTKEEDCKALIYQTVEAFGRIDVIVNNAGIGYIMKPMTQVTQDEWMAVLGVNLMGAFLCTKYAAIQMEKQGPNANGVTGRIINIASQAGKSGFPHMAPYTASKHGLIGLTRSNAVELGKLGITVNAVCPNHVTTGLGAKQNEYFSKYFGVNQEEYMQNMRAKNPMGRPGLPSDTANACAFLASDAAQYITGEGLNVSGGEEMH
ncbi:MAG: SDR family NAD(P)-dependent oxidoreductase [Pseudomonadota bacterium]